ncbi:MAG: hypothetical protein GY725_14280 [bacterium]|nr:hypothetical protein [bacterium]
MKNTTISMVLSALITITAALPGTAQAARPAATEFGLGLATAVVNLVYGPAKVLYAVAGSITGGLAWCVTGGRTDVARAIVQPAVRGDYSVVPEHLTFEKSLSFTGQDPEYLSGLPN